LIWNNALISLIFSVIIVPGSSGAKIRHHCCFPTGKPLSLPIGTETETFSKEWN